MAGLSRQGELNVDVMDRDACGKLADWFQQRWDDHWCLDISEELWDRVQSTNLKGTFLCSRAFGPRMVPRGWGRVINMGSILSKAGMGSRSAYGAELDLTARELGMRGAVDRAVALAATIPGAWIPQQFDNEANIEVHRRTTAAEILADFPDGLDALITGVGTGGHITAVGEELKRKFPSAKVFAVEPEASPILSGGKPGPHPLQGLGANFVPKNLHRDVLDGVITVGKDEAFTYAQRCAREEGIFVGISSGAALAAVAKKIPELPRNARVLTFCYDTGERYLSIEGLF